MFDLKAPYTPKGDQIQAIETLKTNLDHGIKEQILLGATGTGKTAFFVNQALRIVALRAFGIGSLCAIWNIFF